MTYMKKILKVIAIFVFFSTCQYSKAQNILLLKDRFYDIHPFTGEKHLWLMSYYRQGLLMVLYTPLKHYMNLLPGVWII